MSNNKELAAGPSAKNETSRREAFNEKALAVSIYDLLELGKENKKSTRDLMKITGLDERTLRDVVRRERLAGKLIVSTKESGGGYYIPKNAGELKEFLDTMTKEARSIFVMMREARKVARRENGKS